MTTNGKRRGKRPDQRPGFGGSWARNIMMEFSGADASNPGPGAYLPASTFGKHAKHQGKASRSPSPVFRSLTPQREMPHNENVPGAGAYSPEMTAIEPAALNPASSLKGKGHRFGGSAKSRADRSEARVGPGAYDSHEHRTVRHDAAKALQTKSRQSPGFGAASTAHFLPHEESLEELAPIPGPGMYETNTTEIAKANGHSSVFQLPTERKKKVKQAESFSSTRSGKGRRRSKPNIRANGTVHV